MLKSTKTGALLVAGVFALAGCGSSSEAAGSDSPDSPSPTLAVGQDQYAADELEAALTAFKSAQGLTGDVENNDQLQLQLTSATEMTATPEQCVWLMSSLFDKTLADGNLAALSLDGTDGLMVVSYEDSSVLDEQAETGEQLSKDCAEVQLEARGVTLPGAVEAIDASTDAPATQAYLTTITQPNGQAQTLQVRALSGTTSVFVSFFDPADVTAAVATAEESINGVLAELEKK